jgi:micrococcal nuclease
MARQRNSKKGFGIVAFAIAILVLVFNLGRITERNEKPGVAPDTSQPGQREVRAAKAKQPKELRELSTFTGKVIGIKDGDTFEVLYDNQPERVRLAEIDCPEKAQAFGTKAKQYASDLCFGKTVTVTNTGRDRYGRIVGSVVTEEGVNVNEELVKAGFAWHYKQYSDSEILDEYEQQARVQKIGLWSAKRPVAPWDYRRNKRNRR